MTVSGPIDRETNDTYTLTVRVSDDELTDSATLTINVTDVNEAPDLANAQATVAGGQ